MSHSTVDPLLLQNIQQNNNINNTLPITSPITGESEVQTEEEGEDKQADYANQTHLDNAPELRRADYEDQLHVSPSTSFLDGLSYSNQAVNNPEYSQLFSAKAFIDFLVRYNPVAGIPYTFDVQTVHFEHFPYSIKHWEFEYRSSDNQERFTFTLARETEFILPIDQAEALAYYVSELASILYPVELEFYFDMLPQHSLRPRAPGTKEEILVIVKPREGVNHSTYKHDSCMILKDLLGNPRKEPGALTNLEIAMKKQKIKVPDDPFERRITESTITQKSPSPIAFLAEVEHQFVGRRSMWHF
ncbi:hypothetical protein EAF04_008709 [Stromatinia cepivora]|nr:hypothetical protein EAF04_008709 [Stromatinia cepivora]